MITCNVKLQCSKLDDIYSLSNKITRKEFVEKIPNFDDFASLHARTKSLSKYIDIFTQKVKDEFVIRRNRCPLCDSTDFRFLFVKDGFDHMVCNSCDLIFTIQILDEAKIHHLDEGLEGDSYGKYKETTIVKEIDRQKFEIVFEKLEKYTSIKRIFDFGSQAGTFLDWAQEKYSVVGHEYHTPLRTIAQKKGHQVLSSNLENLELQGKFDLITCWDYIDHVINPREVISNLTKHLKKNGLFFFAINNRDSLSLRIMHEYCPMLIGPHHTMLYGINQLKLLMKSYQLLDAESYVSELNWISNWLNLKNPELGDSELMTELLDPKKICELGMGFKVNAIFQKI